MSKAFGIGFGAAVLLIVVIVYAVHNSQKGTVLEPSGKIRNVRTVALDEAHSALLLDFSVTNPSDREMVIRYINVTLRAAKGGRPENTPIAGSDLPALFRYHRELGPLDITPLRERDTIGPHRTATGITAVRFDIPEGELKGRRDVQLEIEDVTGPKVVLIAK